MSVKLEITVPKRLYDLIKRRADERQITVEELILLAINVILKGEGGGGGVTR
ncbi:MAG: hypothetical protein QXU62_04150 [Thermofilaceae archaeon]